jgi:hypothetical protein
MIGESILVSNTSWRAGTDPRIVENEHGGMSVVRLCSCGHRQISGRDAVGAWHCVRCGRRRE